jgi:hypothetical protein
MQYNSQACSRIIQGKFCTIGWKYRSVVVSFSIYVPYDSGLGQYMDVLLDKLEFLSVLEVFNGMA